MFVLMSLLSQYLGYGMWSLSILSYGWEMLIGGNCVMEIPRRMGKCEWNHKGLEQCKMVHQTLSLQVRCHCQPLTIMQLGYSQLQSPHKITLKISPPNRGGILFGAGHDHKPHTKIINHRCHRHHNSLNNLGGVIGRIFRDHAGNSRINVGHHN